MLRSILESLNLETFPVFGNTSQIHPSKSFNSPFKKIETHKKLTIFAWCDLSGRESTSFLYDLDPKPPPNSIP